MYFFPALTQRKRADSFLNQTVWWNRGGSRACSPVPWSIPCSAAFGRSDRQGGWGGTWRPWRWRSGREWAAGRPDTGSHEIGGSGPHTGVCPRVRRNCHWRRGCSTPGEPRQRETFRESERQRERKGGSGRATDTTSNHDEAVAHCN